MHATTEALLRTAEEALMYVVTRPEVVMVRGKGSYIWDRDGKRYLDFIQGWAVNCLGHCPDALVRTLAEQASTLINGSPALYNDRMIALAALLTQHSCLDKAFFCSTGAEANEGALKMARKYGATKLNGATEVITAWNSFHGRTMAMMSATGKEAWDKMFEPKVPDFVRVDFNDLDAARDAVTNKTCAIMVEPVQGEGGVIVGEPEYLQGLRALCDEKAILLILDEVQTGIGRTGSLFAYSQYGIEPDIMTLGKGLGGGFPVAATLAKDAVCLFEAGEQGGTYTAQPLAMAAALAVVSEVIDKGIAEHARKVGDALQVKLVEMGKIFDFGEVRGRGLLIAFELPSDKGGDVVAECMKDGLLINAPRPNTIRLMPALNTSEGEIDDALAIVRRVLERVL